MRLLYIRYAGNFLADYTRIFLEGGKENYYGQKYSIQHVIDQLSQGYQIIDTSLHVSEAYDQEVLHGLRVVGFDKSPAQIYELIAQFKPDAVILRTPDVNLLRYLRRRKIPTFPVFADSFHKKPWYRLRSVLKDYALRRELRHPIISWVANHQLNASRSLLQFSVPADKILPYDWDHSDSPENWHKSSKIDIENCSVKLFYAGQISERKGVFDLLDAVSILMQSGKAVTLKIAGQKTPKLIEYVQRKGLVDSVHLMGLIDHDTVLELMHASHIVIVPSHHDYPEGLPMTIMEGLMTNTPVIASDHPMFVGRCDKYGAVHFFEQKNCDALAEAIVNLTSSDAVYQRAQNNTRKEWHNLVLELKYAEMIDAWLIDPNSSFLKQHSLRRYT